VDTAAEHGRRERVQPRLEEGDREYPDWEQPGEEWDVLDGWEEECEQHGVACAGGW